MDIDPLDSLLNLEDDFYDEGFALGTADGARAGYLEGKAFGIEKGFERFLEMGRIYGRATVWVRKIQMANETDSQGQSVQTIDHPEKLRDEDVARDLSQKRLVSLPSNPRLEKHLRTLLSLVDPTTISMDNNEDAIADFDDRFRRAKAKVKVIEKLIGEPGLSEASEKGIEAERLGHPATTTIEGDGSGNIEDISSLRVRH